MIRGNNGEISRLVSRRYTENKFKSLHKTKYIVAKARFDQAKLIRFIKTIFCLRETKYRQKWEVSRKQELLND